MGNNISKFQWQVPQSWQLQLLLPGLHLRPEVVVWGQTDMFKLRATHGAASVTSVKPFLDGCPYIGLPISSNHRVLHKALERTHTEMSYKHVSLLHHNSLLSPHCTFHQHQTC